MTSENLADGKHFAWVKWLKYIRINRKEGLEMPTGINDFTVLNNGVRMPWLGLGVWQVEDPAQLEYAVGKALEAGYRAVDTAAAYGNEEGVGKCIQKSGIRREELFITTKLWNKPQRKGYDASLKAFEQSRKLLKLEYIDLYLIHWPVKEKYIESWKALIHLQKEGFVRAIGVSNFKIHHLQDIISETGVVPAVNQVELHPWLTQKPLLEFCKKNGIQVEAYSPLMHGHLGEITELEGIALKYGKSPAQIILRWDLQNKVAVIPKSVHEDRIVQNSSIFDFELSEEEMEMIDGMNRDARFLPDPDNIQF